MEMANVKIFARAPCSAFLKSTYLVLSAFLFYRLERVRDAMRRPKEDKEDKVTIKTAEGEFRFEGINKNFTKKLYEWEERRGGCVTRQTYGHRQKPIGR